jgi:ELWxxDGT repeat protein
MKRYLVFALFLSFFNPLCVHAQNPRLLKDINPGTAGCGYGYGDVLNGWYYFHANNGSSGAEMWKSDLTTLNTVMVKDLDPGSGSGGYSGIRNCNGVLYFHGDDGGSAGSELWKSDGSSNGTVFIKDIWSGNLKGSGTPNNSNPYSFTYMNGYTYFQAAHGMKKVNMMDYYIRDLYRTNGTSGGTTLVKELNKTGFGGQPGNFLIRNNILYFYSWHSGYDGYRLTRSDGTSGGTYMVYPNAKPTLESITGAPLLVNNIIYFRADDGTNGDELYRSDGTQAGTWMVKNINTAGGSSPNFFVQFNGVLFFTANDGTHGAELWKSDGTEAGTMMVADINPDGSSDPYWLTPAGSTLYFTAIGPSTDDPQSPKTRQLWKSDGTSQGTVRVATINPAGDCEPAYNVAPVPAYWSNGTRFPFANGKVFFRATDGQNGIELWCSDGTAAGTTLVKDINPGSAGSNVMWLRLVNDKVIFITTTSSYGDELWVLDPWQPISKQPSELCAMPLDVSLHQNYPNPFNPTATIEYSIPAGRHVRIVVHDALGREVATPVDAWTAAGHHRFIFDAGGLPSGTYTYRLESEGVRLARRMSVVK